MTRYRLVRDDERFPPADDTSRIVVAQGQPEDGFPSATEAAIWATEHALDWRWYIQPIAGSDA